MDSETLLEIRDVTCYLDKGVNIFSNISFSVNKGAFIPTAKSMRNIRSAEVSVIQGIF